ncbi:glucokinase [Kitasatospora sp. MAA19]|uniref:ROK family glucokinase n=1 Tax=unclassified Kitasatospora TaxID=2633591 RepID=UPI002476BB11|nr:ROK family glucokinase [Kitasatospora sp. MAA19]MDH6706815.1 glucokinase [Kitasatospora sp. MAA19]
MNSPQGSTRPAVLPNLLGLGPRAERRRRALPAGILRLPTIGVDIGGTKVVAGVVDGEGKVLEKLRTDTPHKSKSAKVVEDVIVELVLELADRHDVHAVGIGAAGWVDADRSTVLFAPHLNWRGEPLKQALSERLRFPVIVENDANAAAWAEWRFGAGRGEDHMVMLTLGTGIGGAVVRDGYVDRGKYGLAGEFGHMQVLPGGHRCPCGNRGCWEQYSSGNALVRDARELVAEESPVVQPLLARAGGTVEGITGPLVTEAARDGDPTATELLYEVGTWLGVGIANLAAALDPGRFVVGGGVSEAGDLLLGPARDTFRRTLTGRGFRPEATIVHAALGNEAGLVGAADLARQVARRFRTIKRRRVERSAS